MSSKYGDLYSETSYQVYHASYARNAKAIGGNVLVNRWFDEKN